MAENTGAARVVSISTSVNLPDALVVCFDAPPTDRDRKLLANARALRDALTKAVRYEQTGGAECSEWLGEACAALEAADGESDD